MSDGSTLYFRGGGRRGQNSSNCFRQVVDGDKDLPAATTRARAKAKAHNPDLGFVTRDAHRWWRAAESRLRRPVPGSELPPSWSWGDAECRPCFGLPVNVHEGR